MALGSLVEGLFDLTETGINLGSQILTNQSNERNVNNTNAANVAMTNATNAANIKIAHDTNKTNAQIAEENNKFNAAQADLAYQRSTASSKVGELIAAGLSPEQARQVVASNGLTGSPSAASGTAIPAVAPTLESPKLQPFQAQAPQLNGLSQFGKSLGDFVDSITTGYTQPNGGTLGVLASQKEFDNATNIIDEIPPKVLASNQTFVSWLKNQPADSNWGKLRDSKSFQKMWNQPLARKGFLWQIQQTYADTAGVQNSLEYQQQQIKLAKMQERSASLDHNIKQAQILNLQEDFETKKIAYQNSLLDLDRNITLYRLQTDTMKAQLERELADATLQTRVLSDPAYRNAYFTSTIGNLSANISQWEYVAYKYKLMQEGASIANKYDSDSLALFAFYDDLGFSSTPLYQDMATIYLKGGSLMDCLQKKGWKSPLLLPDEMDVNSFVWFSNELSGFSRTMGDIHYDKDYNQRIHDDIWRGVQLGADVLKSVIPK